MTQSYEQKKTKIPFDWDLIEDGNFFGHTEASFRTKVFGGWLVKHDVYDEEDEEKIKSSQLIFIADPNHEWEV